LASFLFGDFFRRFCRWRHVDEQYMTQHKLSTQVR
jgi:hypothetical protein